jgi:ribonuclease VapC
VTVLDASAALAFLQNEAGADVVRAHLESSRLGAANLAEVLGRMSGPVEQTLAEGILASMGVRIEPVTAEDARSAARLFEGNRELSLGDRLCLALAERLGEPTVTADRAWGTSEHIIQIR